MPMQLQQLEHGIYQLHVSGESSFDDVVLISQQGLAYREAGNESHQVIIIDRVPDAKVNITFPQIRQLVSQQNMRKTHILHIDTGTVIRMAVGTVNRISPLNIELVPNMEIAHEFARDILSRYTQPRPKNL